LHETRQGREKVYKSPDMKPPRSQRARSAGEPGTPTVKL